MQDNMDLLCQQLRITFLMKKKNVQVSILKHKIPQPRGQILFTSISSLAHILLASNIPSLLYDLNRMSYVVPQWYSSQAIAPEILFPVNSWTLTLDLQNTVKQVIHTMFNLPSGSRLCHKKMWLMKKMTLGIKGCISWVFLSADFHFFLVYIYIYIYMYIWSREVIPACRQGESVAFCIQK